MSKQIGFISNVNGLKVSAPADAFPSRNCGDEMCPLIAEPEAFACTPQLNAASPSPVVFPIEVEAAGESYVGASYNGTTWSTGAAPSGVPAGTTAFTLNSAETGFTTTFNNGTVYAGVEATVYDGTGEVVASGEMVNISTTLWRLQINTVGFPMLEDGATYCVQLTLTPGVE